MSGSFSPSSITAGVEGYTNFTWVASSPTPAGECGGYTPVSQNTFTGVVANRGNDTATSSWDNGQLVGTSNFETNLLIAPTSEAVSAIGFNSLRQAMFSSTLSDTTSYDPPDPNSNKFQGRQVYETISGADTCFAQASASYGSNIPFNQLPNGVVSSWNVGYTGNGNSFGNDSIGYTASEIFFIRNHASDILPCTTTLTQVMKVEVDLPGYPDQQYATNTLQIVINTNNIQVSKNGVTQTLNQ